MAYFYIIWSRICTLFSTIGTPGVCNFFFVNYQFISLSLYTCYFFKFFCMLCISCLESNGSIYWHFSFIQLSFAVLIILLVSLTPIRVVELLFAFLRVSIKSKISDLIHVFFCFIINLELYVMTISSIFDLRSLHVLLTINIIFNTSSLKILMFQNIKFIQIYLLRTDCMNDLKNNFH